MLRLLKSSRLLAVRLTISSPFVAIYEEASLRMPVTYDANGNRVTANGITYQQGTNNRILSDGTYSYGYDDEGNMTSRTLLVNGQPTGEYVEYQVSVLPTTGWRFWRGASSGGRMPC
jgi:YD repeat-containing protein